LDTENTADGNSSEAMQRMASSSLHGRADEREHNGVLDAQEDDNNGGDGVIDGQEVMDAYW
jgi:hypothetical protein